MIAGLALYVSGRPDAANLIWVAGVVPALAVLVVEILRSLRSDKVGLDIVAALLMSAALVFRESLAGVVVAVAFAHRRKVFMVSTPTLRSLSRIERAFEASDQRRYFVSCPHCGVTGLELHAY